MRRSCTPWLATMLALAIFGCGTKAEDAPQVGKSVKSVQDSGLALSLEGPKGKVALGDDMAAAKNAFPSPKGAQVFPTSLSFAIVTPKGWAWSDTAANKSFEAAEKDGKVVGLALTSIAKDKEEPAQTIKKIGEPTRKAIGKSAQMYVWERGDQVRFWITVTGGVMDLGSVTLIGSKDDLKLLNYRADDPETFVKQFDRASEVMKGK